jgi:hypothetical protein
VISLLDDHLLLSVLLGDDGDPPAPPPLATTGLWYHRLARALIVPSVAGAMSRRLGGIDERLAAEVVAATTALPDDVALVSLRDLAGPMARLVADGARLNLLALEAIAAAEHLGATLHLARDNVNPALVEVAGQRGIPVEVVGV